MEVSPGGVVVIAEEGGVVSKTCGRRKEGGLARLRRIAGQGQCTDFRPVDNTNTRLIFS